MASYKILWRHEAEHDLRRLERLQIPRIVEAVESLAVEPFPPQFRKLKGAEHLYRIRIGDYRVLYEVETETRVVTICYVRHRKDAYRKS